MPFITKIQKQGESNTKIDVTEYETMKEKNNGLQRGWRSWLDL